MSILNDVNKLVDKVRDIDIDVLQDSRIKAMTESLDTGISKAVDRAANMVIKSLPLPEFAKDILVDVKDSLKTKDLKQILSTAVKSSVREGLELLGLNKKEIKDVFELKDIALKGGLIPNLKGVVNILDKKYSENNLLDDNTTQFLYKLKHFIQSPKFIEKIDSALNSLSARKDKFMKQVKSWYVAYDNLNIEEMNRIAYNLKRKKSIIEQYPECAKENKVIQNITEMTNNKNEKLSPIQLQLCTTL